MNTKFTIHNELYEITEALPSDTKSIDKIYHDVTIESKIDLSFTRGEDPYNSVMAFGKGSKIFVCKNTVNGECVACIVLGLYKLSLHGKEEDVFYVNGLKILKKYQKVNLIYPRLLKYIYDNYHEILKNAFFNVDKTVEDDKLLYEKRNRKLVFLPLCNYQSEIETKIFKPYKKDTLGLIKGKTEELDGFFKSMGRKYNLFPINGIPTINNDEYLVWKKNNKIVAACAITDQDEYKRYIVRQLKGILKILPFLPLHLFGFPNVPKVGTYVKHYDLSMLAFDDSLTDKEKQKFIKSASSYVKDSDMIFFAVGKNDPSYSATKKIKGLGIPSLIYSCAYEDLDFTDKPIYVDIALL